MTAENYKILKDNGITFAKGVYAPYEVLENLLHFSAEEQSRLVNPFDYAVIVRHDSAGKRFRNNIYMLTGMGSYSWIPRPILEEGLDFESFESIYGKDGSVSPDFKVPSTSQRKIIEIAQEIIRRADLDNKQEREYKQKISDINGGIFKQQELIYGIIRGNIKLAHSDGTPIVLQEEDVTKIKMSIGDGRSLRSLDAECYSGMIEQIDKYRKYIKDVELNNNYSDNQIKKVLLLNPKDFADKWTEWTPPAAP